MFTLDELGFECIGRFIEPQIINIASLGNLIQVDGENRNTGGSSGAAKSTIFHALDYLFGLNSISNAKLQSRLTKEGISVWAKGNLDGKPIKISRSKAKGLSIEGAGMDVSGNSKLAEEKLDEIIAMPRDLFHKIYHKLQGEGGFFLNFTPKDTNDFLMNCLGLKNLKAKADLIDKNLKTFIELKEENVRFLQNAREGYTATQNAFSSLGSEPIRDVDPEVVKNLKATLNLSEANLTTILSGHKAAIVELNKTKPIIVTTPFDRTDIENYEKELKTVRETISIKNSVEIERINKAKENISALKLQKSNLEHQVVIGKTLQEDAEKLVNQIKKIRESICPTCAQNWATDQAKLHETELTAQLVKIRPGIERGKQAEISISELNKKMEELLPELLPREVDVTAERNRETSLLAYLADQRLKEMEHNRAENNRISTVSDKFNAEVRSLQEKQSKEADLARGQVDIDRRTYDAANFKLQSYETAKARYEQSLSNLKRQESEYLAKIEKLEKKAKELEIKVLMTEEAKRALKIFISCSFDEALEAISVEATRIIRHIPNMATATVQLEGQRETGKGAIKEEVTAVIHVDGEENVPIETFSGGERSALDLAIDLAVIDLIELKTGKGINIFVLDEPFTGLGAIEIEMALEVLKNSNSNKKLMVVDHNPIVKEHISERILVIREGLISRLAP